jgi:hypothetical protein
MQADVYAFLEFPNGRRVERRFSPKNWEVIKNDPNQQRNWKEIKFQPPVLSDKTRDEIERYKQIVETRKNGGLPEGVELNTAPKTTRKELVAKLQEQGIPFDADMENMELEGLLLTGVPRASITTTANTSIYSEMTNAELRNILRQEGVTTTPIMNKATLLGLIA